jgi:phosphoglycerate kinase
VAAGHRVGKSLYEPELVNEAKAIMTACADRGVNLPIPLDVVVADRFSDAAIASIRNIDEVQDDEMILDVGPKTRLAYHDYLDPANTVIWNGPVGVFEMPQFSEGTKALAEVIAQSGAFSLAGGGDTIAAIEKFKVKDKISYISTGGGAFLEFLEGKPLPGIRILEQRYDAIPRPL